ncbi:nucleolar protein 6 [Stomoxys calcitrans]|uniref:nucleolar protein 6 n=1 Tax=Stomoxys calcitrans TaxID=35570 RepID=UPI0027E25533|nr:nucleolar protein 6 [Stomoxys calcitrans]
MAKSKKPFLKKKNVVIKEKVLSKGSNDEEGNELADGYDSMIENGTSEDSDSTGGDDSSDDGFSEKEEQEDSVKPIKHLAASKNKRKMEPPALAHSDEPPQAKKTKLSTAAAEKVKPPTLEEINELKETRNLFHSNLFRLQIKEMLGEVKVKEKVSNYITTFMDQFKIFVKTLKDMPEKEDINELSFLKNSSIVTPLSIQALKLQQQKLFQFQFLKSTTEPFFIGACGTKSLLGPRLQADICVIMPEGCFQKDNFLNLQYDQKRAFYLTYLTQKLIESDSIPGLNPNHLKFVYYNNNPLKPLLEITPPEAAGKKIAQKLIFRIFVSADQASFKLNRFVPWNNNIRPSLYGEENGEQLATPCYNANILFDLTMQRNQQLLDGIFENRKNFQEGFILLKVWLRQRQLDLGYCGFSSHMMAMFIAYLIKQRKLHNNMSSYQVARNVWNNLALSCWNEPNKGISLCDKTATAPNQPTMEQFHDHYSVVFIDVTGFLNICYNLSEDIYQRIKLESQLAVDMLNDMKLNSFQFLFMTKMPLYSQMDHVLKINKPDAVEQILEIHISPQDKYNSACYTYPQLLTTVTKLLKKGLDKRIEFLIPLEEMTLPWNINEPPSHALQQLHLGLILNPDKAYEILDKGPESIDESAAKFRAFWGEKAQLRRFQDGTITESVVWASANDSLAKKRLIVRSIVLYILEHHYQLEEKDVEYIAGEFDLVYSLTKSFKVDGIKSKYNIQQDTNAEALSLHVIQEFDDLARKLNALKELPLEIVSIAGISPVLRYCEPQPVLPQARYIQEQLYANHIQYGIIQLGLSGKWPGELAAFRALKTAFYIQIASLLKEQHNLQCRVTYDGIMVLKQGYCFNLEIAHPKEVGLLKKEKTEKGITRHVDCVESIALEKRHYILPKVAGALKALHQSCSSFGPTVMIAKRWLYSQLIDDGQWPEECTELLIASQYLKTSSKFIGNSPQMAFIRFLHLLANADWKSELFLINFNNAMDESEISDVEHRFGAERNDFPPLCIVTSYDKQYYGKIWSSHLNPNVHVLARVTLLARQCLEIVESTLLASSSFVKPVQIFKPSSEGYDLVIQLKPEAVPNTLAFDFGSSFVEFTKPNWHMPLAGSNFVKLAVNKLREAYGEFAAFFYNPCGGKEIALVWKPYAFEAKDFKVNDVNGCCLMPDHKKIQAKKENLTEDFKFILKDFYLRLGTVEAVKKASEKKPIEILPKGNESQRYFSRNKPQQQTTAPTMEIKSTKSTKAATKTKPLQKKSKKTKKV